MQDKTITIRLPFDLLDRLESKVNEANRLREAERERGEAMAHASGNKFKPTDKMVPVSISEAIRRFVLVGLDVSDGGESAREWFYQFYEEELRNVIALAVHDKKARASLEAITERVSQESAPLDFG